MEKKAMFLNSELCTGCRSCELICSLKQEGVCSPRLSRIRIIKDEARGNNRPTVCYQCTKPLCAEACPVQAISRNTAGGLVIIDEAACIGCKNCLTACPFGAINLHPEKETIFKCDLCGGEPSCTRYCPSGAITFQPVGQVVMVRKRTGTGEILPGDLKIEEVS